MRIWLKKTHEKIRVIYWCFVLIVLLFLLVGCNEVQKAPEEAQPKTNIKPLSEQLIPARQDWKGAYGDTLESQMAYNLVILRNNQLEIAKMISKMHPSVDPNVPIDPNEAK